MDCKKGLILLLALFLFGCYNQRKAQKQISRADTSYPQIIPNICADRFPVLETIVKGDSVIVFDTIQGEGITVTETVTIRDTVRIIKTLPAKIITKTIHIVDTVYGTNTAAIKACEIERGQAIQLATDKTNEAVSWKKKAKNRFWTLVGIGGAGLLVAGFAFRRKVAKT